MNSQAAIANSQPAGFGALCQSGLDVAEFTRLEACWVCAGNDLTPVDRARIDLSAYRHEDPELADYSGHMVNLSRCAACRFMQPDRLPALPRFFERMYNQQWADEWIAREFESTAKDRIFDCVLRGLAGRVPAQRRALLDVGTHAGRFLSLASARGWTAEGIEVNQRTAAHAARATSCCVHRHRAEEIDRLGRRYDAVTLTDVLEHLPRPVEFLMRVRSVLNQGGWLAVKVPCGPAQRRKEHARARLQSGYRPRLADNLVHVSHFSPQSLRLALARAGFEAIAIEVGAPESASSLPSNLLRSSLYYAARMTPFGVHSPAALNLQAFARARRGES
jgi:SAM-dependent methyltransferase